MMRHLRRLEKNESNRPKVRLESRQLVAEDIYHEVSQAYCEDVKTVSARAVSGFYLTTIPPPAESPARMISEGS